MSKAPERIWINRVYGKHPEDWVFTDGEYHTQRQLKNKVEYVRADRIEELEAKLATCEKYRNTYAECDRIGTQAVRDLEAKLKKALGALGDIFDGEPEWPDDPAKELSWCRNRARDAYAELTRGKDERQ